MGVGNKKWGRGKQCEIGNRDKCEWENKKNGQKNIGLGNRKNIKQAK